MDVRTSLVGDADSIGLVSLLVEYLIVISDLKLGLRLNHSFLVEVLSKPLLVILIEECLD
jgi:hypothetical protein